MAKLLGLAVLAFFMLAAFDNNLELSVNALDLTPSQKAVLRTQEAGLGGADDVKGAKGEDIVVIDRAVDQAFVSAFRFAMVISAGMAPTSAIAASLLIQGKKGNEPGKPGPRAGG